MIYFDGLDKVTDVISRPTPTLIVKHVVRLKRQDPMNKNSKRGYAFSYNNSNLDGNSGPHGKGENGPPSKAPQYSPTQGLYFDGTGYILFEGFRVVPNSDGSTYTKKLTCEVEAKNVSAFLTALDNAYAWLIGKNYKKIYISDTLGRPFKIGEATLKEVAPLSQTAYVAFKPCIVRDASDVKYEGIAMGTQDGEITNFVAPEFASFRMQMQCLLPNLYLANGILVNQAMQYCTYTNMMEAFAKNGKH